METVKLTKEENIVQCWRKDKTRNWVPAGWGWNLESMSRFWREHGYRVVVEIE